MKSKFYLFKSGAQSGPFSKSQILELLNSGKLLWADSISDKPDSQGVLIIEHPEFSERFLPQFVSSGDSRGKDFITEKEWFILRDGSNYGPFSQIDLIQMLQGKSLYEFDYAWHSDLPAWAQLSSIPEFSPENIRKIKERADLDTSEIFFRRRHLRARIGSSLIVHNNKSVFRGESLEISSGGAGIVLNSSSIQPGQTLFLHFKPGEGVPPFNAICQVVSKQTLKAQSKTGQDQPTKYGVRFTSINSQIRESINIYAKKHASAS